eukprot:XP_019074278.1 PREDICTED: uncharacterized protein LOC109122250 isoform X2 [Vitis vinifera]
MEETPLLTVVDSYSSVDIKGGDDHGGNTSWAEAFAQYLLANSKDYMEELQEVKVFQYNHFSQDKVGGWERAHRGPRGRERLWSYFYSSLYHDKINPNKRMLNCLHSCDWYSLYSNTTYFGGFPPDTPSEEILLHP